ncbi:MAG: hypothetical protein U0989_18265 [Azonexus sp.]|nr:hypothetical protein [Azonexus sp.]
MSANSAGASKARCCGGKKRRQRKAFAAQRRDFKLFLLKINHLRDIFAFLNKIQMLRSTQKSAQIAVVICGSIVLKN